MEFVDNTGHIFSIKSYNEKPIGYEYEETNYIFWIDANTSKLSINNYYSRPIYALYLLDKDYNINDLQDDDNSPIQISIEIENSNVYKLISSKEFNSYILSNEYTNLNDYIDLGNADDSQYLKSSLSNKDLYVIKTTETVSNTKTLQSVDFNYLLIPIYPIGCATEEGTWISNIMIHIHDTNTNVHEWCPISIGGEFINEYEELIINGKNIGVSLPKDILKAVYPESLYNDEFNESLYNEKLKEYLINKNIIRSECGNFNSAIASLKWFGYGDKISISKLLKTDNTSMSQYLLDYFNVKNDIIDSFKSFTSSALISLKLMLNKELDEVYPFNPNLNYEFFGENKPKMLSLLDHYEKVKIGNHDMPIDEDDEKYWYWKPYFDFSFNELGIKLALLKKFYKQYFLPIHLYIHNASLGYKVYANDIKYTITTGVSMSEPIISLNIKDNEVKFSNDSTYYFSKQIHYIDHNFNEFDLNDIEHDNRSWYYLNDTCVNIPIEFISNERNKGYFNCVFILFNKNISHEPLFESHFIFTQTDQYAYKNFIIYPKKLNINVRGKISDDSNISMTSKYYEYWINDDFELKLLVNNRWYEHKFNLKIHNPTLDFGTLRYRYYLNEHNYLLNRISSNISNVHSLIFTNELDQINKLTNINIDYDINHDINYYNDSLFNLLNLDDSKSFIKTLDISDIDNLWQRFESNYDILSPFTQLNRLDHDNKVVSFNSFMHNCELVNVNNIDYDIDFYKILKYHLDKNLMYIDGTLLNQDFYQYIIYPYNGKDVEVLIHKDMIGYPIEIPLQYFNKDKLVICSHNGNIYILEEASENSDSYHINVMNNNNSIIASEDEHALLLDSLSLEYDKINNAYYSKDPITGEINGYYPIYDKLYNNLDYIYEKYSSNINLPNLDKYKNSLHLFNIYTLDKHEQNILVFHNDINILINGLIFTHNSYDYENEYDSLKIHISGKPNKDNISTQYLDVYGLHLIEPYIENGHILNIPEEIKLYNYEYGLYVKRDYSLYYDSEGSDETRPEIYELPNIFEYDTNEFTYYDDNRKYLGSLKFNTLNDFYNDNRIDECIDIDGTWYIYGINTELSSNYVDKPFLRDGKWYAINKETNEEIDININEIFKEDSVYYAYDTEIKDLSNLDNYYKNKLAYKVKFYGNNDTLLTGVSLNNIYGIEYKYLEIELFYYPKHIVRNRFYLLIDYMVEYIEQGYSFEFIDETHIRMYRDNESYDIELIKLTPKYLYKNTDDSYIPNQNPAYYWYNVDNNSITSLSSYLNELERYIYNGKEQTLDSMISQLDMYVEKFEHNKNIDNLDDYADDSVEARYHYYNYLSKDFTGKKGTYRLKLDSNFITDFTVRLKLDVIDANGYKTTYTNLDGEFTLIGNEQSVILYIQLSDLEDTENIDNWIVPQLLEITTIDKQLEYNYEESGDDYILAHILNKNYYYGNNKNENVYNLYNDFFDLKFNIYDAYVENNHLICTLLNSVYDVNNELKLHMYLDYDFYLMHDDKYWYGLYISRETCDKVQKHSDLILPEENKIMSLNSKTSDTIYKLKYQASSKEYLINRLEFISSNGFNHFKDDDIVACYINNNDRLPFNPYISSKWSISPMSLGMSEDSKFESNAEMTILSMPKNNNKYQKGYYKATVKYSLDRDIQHQFKNTSTFLIS